MATEFPLQIENEKDKEPPSATTGEEAVMRVGGGSRKGGGEVRPHDPFCFCFVIVHVPNTLPPLFFHVVQTLQPCFKRMVRKCPLQIEPEKAEDQLSAWLQFPGWTKVKKDM